MDVLLEHFSLTFDEVKHERRQVQGGTYNDVDPNNSDDVDRHQAWLRGVDDTGGAQTPLGKKCLQRTACPPYWFVRCTRFQSLSRFRISLE